MEHIYSKIKPEKRLHTIYRLAEISKLKGRVDFTEENEFLQCSIMSLIDGKTYRPHKHIIKSQNISKFQVQEAFIMIGQALVVIYDLDDSKLCEVILDTGDLAVLLAGGHSIKSLSPCSALYEIKTGPYEGQKLDKEFIGRE